MVLPLSGWTSRLNQVPNISAASSADINFATAISDLTNPLEVVGGVPGVITFATSVFASALDSLQPTSGSAWAATVANAWQSAIAASVITPGTVTDPTWSGSGNKDTGTLPTGAATVVNLAAVTTQLTSALLATNPAEDMSEFAQSFRDATLAMQFQVIGNGPPPGLPEIPLIKGVE